MFSMFTELVFVVWLPFPYKLSKALVNLMKCSVCKAFNTASGCWAVPSNHAGPVKFTKPPVAYLVPDLPHPLS